MPSYMGAQVLGAFLVGGGPLIGGASGVYLYDFSVRDVLIGRGAEPDPEMAEAGETALDEPGGAA